MKVEIEPSNRMRRARNTDANYKTRQPTNGWPTGNVFSRTLDELFYGYSFTKALAINEPDRETDEDHEDDEK